MPRARRCLRLLALLWIVGAPGQPAPDDCSAHCDLAHGCCGPDGQCKCDPGWEGQHCERCVRMPGCLHGTCHQPWQCICHSGWAGKFCDKDEHICTERPPCQNGAQCVYEGDGGYRCLCPPGFHGHDCELKEGPCERARAPCQNGGQCQDDRGYAQNFTCRCLAGFVGPRCEVDVDDCLMRPCANGATCRDGINRFSCLCPAGFAGRFCTVNLDDCASRPCQNGARCRDRVRDFDCVCPDGFGGKTCQFPVRAVVPLAPSHPPTDPPPPPPLLPAPPPRPPAQAAAPATASPPQSAGAGLLRISVKEVVRRREGPGLREPRLVAVLVFGALTAALVLATALLTRRAWRRGPRGPRPPASCCCPPRPPPPPGPERHDRECQVSMLPSEPPRSPPGPAEPGKTTAL
ncbi:protein delta homolog 2 [Ornithorhynchus anatinus]|nr:protein delta homolog 2 [Ornithorhynchus anatinus]